MKKLLFASVLLMTCLAAFHAPAAEAPVKQDVVYTIPIRGMIEPALLYVIRRGVAEARATDAKAIIFIMDTPGGTVDAASEIVRTIQNVNIPTYTFVEKNAFSAGAIIALATRHIYMAPGSVIGDAMPIMMSPFGGVQEMTEDLKEKAVSGVAALIRSAAEAGGHDKALAEKMVRRDEVFKINDEVICPAGQLLTLTNIEAEKPIGKQKQPLLSSGTVKDVNELLQKIDLSGAEVRELKVTAVERIARMIAAAAPLFLIGGLLGIYVEIKTPGFGLPGILGILSLAIFFWGHHIAGLAGMEDLLIFTAGAVLLVVEILFIPGFGVIGVTGIVLMLWAVLSAMVTHYPGSPWYPTWEQMQFPLVKLSVALVVGTGLAAWLSRYLPDTILFRRLVLAKATRHSEGFAASSDASGLLASEGKALSDLRPSGSAMFGDRKVDVLTSGEYLPAGSRIRVVETHGNRIIVAACESKSDKKGPS
ncbi:MAG TPA: NfeD family protein [Kiritimatiellia bacterium]|nr:NfeD family protein [Kiritimatiellia bacterium]